MKKIVVILLGLLLVGNGCTVTVKNSPVQQAPTEQVVTSYDTSTWPKAEFHGLTFSHPKDFKFKTTYPAYRLELDGEDNFEAMNEKETQRISILYFKKITSDKGENFDTIINGKPEENSFRVSFKELAIGGRKAAHIELGNSNTYYIIDGKSLFKIEEIHDKKASAYETGLMSEVLKTIAFK